MVIINLNLFDKNSKYYKYIKYHAITIGFFIIVFVRNPSKYLIEHEKVHVKQFLKDPFLFYIKYILFFIRNLFIYKDWYIAYYNIPYEIEAREIVYSKKMEDNNG